MRPELPAVREALFSASDGSVPVWVGLEYMAQCAAAHAGLVARALLVAGRLNCFTPAAERDA